MTKWLGWAELTGLMISRRVARRTNSGDLLCSPATGWASPPLWLQPLINPSEEEEAKNKRTNI